MGERKREERTRYLSGLPLRVVEVSGHSDDRILDLGTKVGLRGLFHLIRFNIQVKQNKQIN